MDEYFKDIKKVRSRATLHEPVNALKTKVGSGGFSKDSITRAQSSIDNNKADIKPVVTRMIGLLTDALGEVKAGRLQGELAIETIIAPVMQLEAHGQMFNHPQISKISHIFIDFLETITIIDDSILEIASAFMVSANTLMTVAKNDVTTTGKALCESLLGACTRYHHKKK